MNLKDALTIIAKGVDFVALDSHVTITIDKSVRGARDIAQIDDIANAHPDVGIEYDDSDDESAWIVRISPK